MDIDYLLRLAEDAVEDLRKRGDTEKADAIATLLGPLRAASPAAKDLLTRTESGQLMAVSGQTLREWVQQEKAGSFTVGGGFRMPWEALAEYVERAGASLDLDPLSDEEAAALIRKP